MQKEIEEDKIRQRELYNEQKFQHDQEMLRKRYEDEQRREMHIDYGQVAKNREKFQKVFMKSGKNITEKSDAKEERDGKIDGSGGNELDQMAPENDIGADSKIEDVFDAEVIFRRQKPAYSVENSRNERPNFETSFASNEFDVPQNKPKRDNNPNDFKDSLDDIKRQQQRNIMNQMEVEREYRPHVIGNAPIQGYGLNRNRQTSYEALVQQYTYLMK